MRSYYRFFAIICIVMSFNLYSQQRKEIYSSKKYNILVFIDVEIQGRGVDKKRENIELIKKYLINYQNNLNINFSFITIHDNDAKTEMDIDEYFMDDKNSIMLDTLILKNNIDAVVVLYNIFMMNGGEGLQAAIYIVNNNQKFIIKIDPPLFSSSNFNIPKAINKFILKLKKQLSSYGKFYDRYSFEKKIIKDYKLDKEKLCNKDKFMGELVINKYYIIEYLEKISFLLQNIKISENYNIMSSNKFIAGRMLHNELKNSVALKSIKEQLTEYEYFINNHKNILDIKIIDKVQNTIDSLNVLKIASMSYFPLEYGLFREYKFGKTIIQTSLIINDLQENIYVAVIKNFIWDRSNVVTIRNLTECLIVYEKINSKIYIVAQSPNSNIPNLEKIEPRHLILDYPLNIGTTWIEYSNIDEIKTNKVVDFSECTVPAGTFDKVCKIYFEIKYKNKNKIEKMEGFNYFALDVGLIKQECKNKDGSTSTVFELMSY